MHMNQFLQGSEGWKGSVTVQGIEILATTSMIYLLLTLKKNSHLAGSETEPWAVCSQEEGAEDCLYDQE